MITCLGILILGLGLLTIASRGWQKLLLVLLVLVAQFLWWGWPRFSHGPLFTEPYRLRERTEAHHAWMRQPTAANEAAFRREDELMYAHLAKWTQAGILAVLIFDGVGFYYFWNYKPKSGGFLSPTPNRS